MPINGVPSMKLPKDFEELMQGIKWNRIIPPMVSVLQPVIIFGLWLGFAKVDKKASALSKFIAMAEPIPAIDLNLPKPVVLASLFHSTDTALKILGDVIEFFQDIEIPSVPDIVEEIKEEITEPIKEEIAETVEEALPDDPAFKEALANCVMNAKKNLPFGSYYIFGVGWIVSCMAQKGFQVSKKMIEDAYF